MDFFKHIVHNVLELQAQLSHFDLTCFYLFEDVGTDKYGDGI